MLTLKKTFKLEACDTCVEAAFYFDADTLNEPSIAMSVADGDDVKGTFYLTADDLRALSAMLADGEQDA